MLSLCAFVSCQLLEASVMAAGATEAANAAIAAAINGGGRRKSASNGKPVTRSSSGRKRSSDTQAGGKGEHEGVEQTSGGTVGLPRRTPTKSPKTSSRAAQVASSSQPSPWQWDCAGLASTILNCLNAQHGALRLSQPLPRVLP